ncbi:hypothetical protein C1645_738938 [Glomus cerebriforme]|uniref:MIR domain-containing protein n=1 Tax=Glomus cerebriforme TaxID=658196 RepID=A0A397STK0_9GLOM|nr:hypothetical protein C1645_738938 [Glomus cerebriforme]
MGYPKYDGTIHPDEWIKLLQQYGYGDDNISHVISLIDYTIKLPTGIYNIEQLHNALKEDISFTIFKNTNKRKLQSLNYIPESKGGNTSEFILNFRKLCYNAEINDIEEQKKYLYKSLAGNNHYNILLTEFYKKMENIDSMVELIKEFEEFVTEETNLIRNGSIIALKHVPTGKYLSSIDNLFYKTGTGTQLVFAGSLDLWTIKFDKVLANYTNNLITLQHVASNKFLGIYGEYKSPSTECSEVSCNNFLNNNYWGEKWKFNNSKLKNYRGYLKSNDIINLSIKKMYVNGQYTQNGPDTFLRSHDVQFTVGNDVFQEVLCHDERLGGNDEWCIELIKQG